jgi:hypothetical protein
MISWKFEFPAKKYANSRMTLAINKQNCAKMQSVVSYFLERFAEK